MNNLSISLSEPSKRYLRSQKKYILASLAIILLACAIFRIWNARDKSTFVYPEESIMTIGIVLTPANTSILHNNIGSKIIMPNSGLDWDNAMGLANSQLSIHLDNNGSIFALTLDHELDGFQLRTLENQGIFTYLLESKTLISNKAVQPQTRDHFYISLMPLWPFFDGFIRSGNENGLLNISKDKMSLDNLGTKQETQFSDLYLPKDAQAILYSSSSLMQNDTISPILNDLLSASTAFNQFIISNNSPWRMIIFKNSDNKLVYTIQLEEEIDIEQLTALAKQLVQSNDLSTQALTIDDDSQYQELIVYNNDIDISISTENGASFIHASSPVSNINITQANESTLISNIDFTQTLEKSGDGEQLENEIIAYADISVLKNSLNLIPSNILINSFSKLIIKGNDLQLFW
jgi:hypothetical protein